MPKPIDLPPKVARAFAKDMRAFHAAETGFERDEIAARQLHALREFAPSYGRKLRITDIHTMFLAMREDV